MPKVIALGLTHPGTVRNRNEDAFYLLDKLVPGLPDTKATSVAHTVDQIQFYAIADGMGGHGVGDVAALAALSELDTIRRQIKNPSRFDFSAFARDYTQRANQAVQKALQQYQSLNAGTAILILCLVEDSAFVLALGNCRCYRLREGILTRLTEDDVLPDVQPRRLSRFLGQSSADHPVETNQLLRFALQQGDVFLLTTDGITDFVSDDEIADRLNAPETFAIKPEGLMNLVLTKEARDNLSLVLLRILDPIANEPVFERQARPVRHRQKKARLSIIGLILRAILILVACILTGFVAGWLTLTIFF
jgi:serine/threonine protein phosphatase PrpC